MALFNNLSPTPLKTLAVPSDVPSVGLRDFTTVGSHSWTEIDGDPVLAVPGSPPKWLAPRLPLRVPADEGLRFIDHTGAQCERLGVSRLLPLIHSVEICTPTFDFHGLDVLCNRNNLRNLLSWIEGPADTVKEYRIDLHLTNGGKTLVMLEYEIDCTEFVPQGTFRGFGDNFRKRCVKAPVGQSRHNRIVTFRLGSLHFMMGHKVEAYVEENQATRQDDLDSLVSSFGGIRIAGQGSTPAASPTTSKATSSTNETVSLEGEIPVKKTKDAFKDYAFVEIKTIGQRKAVDWRLFHPQLYLSQTKQVLVAKHARGEFVSIDKYQLNDLALREHKERTEQSMGKLLEFIKCLLETLKSSEDGPWALICSKGVMKLYKSTEIPPQDALSRFD